MSHKSWQGWQAFFNQWLQIKNNLMFFNAVLLDICIMEKEMSFFNRNKVILEIIERL